MARIIMSTQDEDKNKPIPSGRPYPGIKKAPETPNVEKEPEQKGRGWHPGRVMKGRGLALTLAHDYRFWMVIISFVLGFLAGRF